MFNCLLVYFSAFRKGFGVELKFIAFCHRCGLLISTSVSSVRLLLFTFVFSAVFLNVDSNSRDMWIANVARNPMCHLV
jgi:hypothetical protein